VLYRTVDGQAVRRIRKGEYEILASRIALHLVDSERG
jgi:hypothetical protein